CKDFGGVQILKNIDFELKKGEIHGIVGQNGAGKSVFMKILDGVYKKSSGRMLIEGKEVSFQSPIDAKKAGIGMVFQELSLIPNLTVAKNIFLNREPRKGPIIDDAKMIKSSSETLNSLGIDINPKAILKDLSISYKQIVEIAKVVSHNCKIVIMDEPTASLGQSEAKLLFDTVKKLKEKSISIIYISHHLKEIFEICDRVTVLRDGQKILTDETKKLDMSVLVEAMLGKKIVQTINFNPDNIIDRNNKPMLEVKDLNIGGTEKISFKLWPGEVLGFAGLLGAGQEKIIQSIFGIEPKLSKELFLQGKKVTIKKPEDSLKYKITMVPEDRQTHGLIVDQTIKDNTVLSILDKLKKFIFFKEKKAREISKKYVKDLNIATTSIFKKIRLLSGGNQQKVVIAKNLAADPDVMILNDPNVGVDIGSKKDILQLIRDFSDSGKSSIFISSEFEELARICDRVLVMKNNIIVKEFIRKETEELTESMIMHAAQ
ncbi:MAG TPA: sugar ABC transporter ATP-binding protein, partial [Actinobacteria bacterium]|nr:sugar ABC transporter ATP-binding protein [Actinomycetota bacterium]